MKMSRYLTVFLTIFVCLHAIPLKYPSETLDFMRKFGYIDNDNGESEALYTEDGLSNIIRTMQRFGAIPETGRIDNATIKLMKTPRCGVPDIIPHRRQKRYQIGTGSGWNKRQITYYIANWSPQLGEKSVEKNVQLALNTWAQYGHLHFHRVYTPNADIIVAFGTFYHGDNFPFDGPGNILAHAFFPNEYGSLGGDIHFDESETWVDNYGGNQEDGTDFFTVALHEFGHSLGLAHSDVRNSIMSPYYQGYDETKQFKLTYDDIIAMYQLYISRRLEVDLNTQTDEENTESTSEISTVTTESTKPSIPTSQSSTTTKTTTPIDSTTPSSTISSITVSYEGDFETVDEHKKHEKPKNASSILCDANFDAIATLRGDLFVFKEKFIWRFQDKGKIVNGYPVLLHQMFPTLPTNITKIDAAYERPDGMIVLFSGHLFWIYNGERFIENSPKSIQQYGFLSSINRIDAVQIWNRNKKTYFYSGELFWRYNETTKTMDPNYPKSIVKMWRGLPAHLDAAVTWKDGITYFFKGDIFYSFDNDWVYVTDESPLPTAQIWCGCPENVRMNELFNKYN